MSVRLMADIWDMRDLSPVEKLSLLALADWANDGGLAWPSINQIAEKTGCSRRTVQGAFAKAESLGILTRNQVAGKGCTYTIHSQHDMGAGKENHYLYEIVDQETGEFYLGARSCYGAIEDDTYMGSGPWVKAKISAGSKLKKSILSEHKDRTSLALAEHRKIKEVISLDRCKNMKIPNPKSLPPTGNRGAPPAPRTTCAVHHTAQTRAAPAPNTSVNTIKKRVTKVTPKISKSFSKPESVSQQVWDDFCAHRKAKKAPVSETAMNGIAREAERAGWSLEDALTEIVARNWQGFKAEWIKSNGGNNRNSGANTGDAILAAISRVEASKRQNPANEQPGGHDRIGPMPDTVRAIGYAGG